MTKSTHVEIITWADHHEPDDKQTWDDATAKDKLAPVLIVSAGVVTSENETMVELARDYNTSDGMAGAFLHIIKSCIVSRKRVAVPTKRKR